MTNSKHFIFVVLIFQKLITRRATSEIVLKKIILPQQQKEKKTQFYYINEVPNLSQVLNKNKGSKKLEEVLENAITSLRSIGYK